MISDLEIEQQGFLVSLNVLAESIRSNYRKSVEHLLKVGLDLIEAKKLCPDGMWVEWLGQNFGMSIRTAQNLMAVAREFSGREISGDISNKVLYALAAPSVPESVRDIALGESASGFAPSMERVKELKSDGVAGVYVGTAAVLDLKKEVALTSGDRVFLIAGFPANPAFVYLRRGDDRTFLALRSDFSPEADLPEKSLDETLYGEEEPIEGELVEEEEVEGDEPLVNDGIPDDVFTFLQNEDLEGLVAKWAKKGGRIGTLVNLGWDSLLDDPAVRRGHKYFIVEDQERVIALIEKINHDYAFPPDEPTKLEQGVTVEGNRIDIVDCSYDPPPTSVEIETRQRAERLGLPSGDQVFPDPDRDKLHASPHDVDDRPFAMPATPMREWQFHVVKVGGFGNVHELVSALVGQGWSVEVLQKDISEANDAS